MKSFLTNVIVFFLGIWLTVEVVSPTLELGYDANAKISACLSDPNINATKCDIKAYKVR